MSVWLDLMPRLVHDRARVLQDFIGIQYCFTHAAPLKLTKCIAGSRPASESSSCRVDIPQLLLCEQPFVQAASVLSVTLFVELVRTTSDIAICPGRESGRIVHVVGWRAVAVDLQSSRRFSHRESPFGLVSIAVPSYALNCQRFRAPRPTRSEDQL